jgi:hypothetical protein
MPSMLHRRKSRLTKKAMQCTPTVVAPQNVLMRKLGVTGEGEMQSSDFEKYLQMFREGLTERQTELILELFKGTPGMLESLMEIAEE